MTANELKFLYVLLCFFIALSTSKTKDRQYLIIGMGFTAAADYFLLINGNEHAGVVLFIFTHAAYILRTGINKKWVIIALLLALLLSANLLTATLCYTIFFTANLFANIKNPRPIILTGLILFALCDINVLLYNLPRYITIPETISKTAYTLIWWFYAPSQLLLALSGFRNIPLNRIIDN
jgi:hypothetical protein